MKQLSCISLSVLFLSVALALLAGCREGTDPRLLHADSLMEEHPDSALAILEAYSLPKNATGRDRAMYGMLLTQARYKNFIDETDDSLINASVDYFLEKGMKEESARALFQAGMIRMNSGKLGEAAVSFHKGLDIAHDCNSYMWEGQCARGLSILYERLDGSGQVKYAKQAYDAFLKSGYKDWIDYSKLDMARAYSNHEQYEESLALIDELIKAAAEEKDTLILSESLHLKGLSLFAVGKLSEAIESYNEAYELNHAILTDNDKRNIEIALDNITDNSLPDSISLYMDRFKIKSTREEAFIVLARQGKYKEAYESLERYKNKQDSAISLIYRNNVTESVSQYDNMMNTLKESKARNERLIYWIIILLAVILCMAVFLRYKETLHKEKESHLKTVADMESLRSDLMAQLEKAKQSAEGISKYNEEADYDFEKIIRQRYADVNALCDDYYQDRFSKNEKKDMDRKVKEILQDFTERPGLDKIEEYVNENSAGLYFSFKKDFFDLPEESHRLFLYLMLGFNSRSISVIICNVISAVYNKKSRLKTKIADRDSPRKEDYLKFF